MSQWTGCGPGKPLMEKQNTALTTLRCLRLGNNCRSKPSIILRVTFSMGSIDHVATATRIMLPVIRDIQPLVRRRPIAFCRDSIKDPVACSVSRDQIAQLPVVPWTTDPHTHAELISRAIIACAKKAFPLNTKPRKDSGQARTIVLGAPHQLRCAALGITFAAWAQRPCVVDALELEVRDIHISKTASCLRVSLRTIAGNGDGRSNTRSRSTLQQASPKASFVVLLALSRSRLLPLQSWNLKTAPVSWMSVRPPSAGCVLPRNA